MAVKLASPRLYNVRATFPSVRTRAQIVWRGPTHVRIEEKNDAIFAGWPHLALEVRLGRRDLVEARTIYANPFDRSQNSAVLRAVSWDGEATQNAIRLQGDDYSLVVPVRFVRLKLAQVKNWLRYFERHRVSLSAPCPREDTRLIRRLRIERDYITCTIEKTWMAEEIGTKRLSHTWDQVWTEMTNLIGTTEAIEVPKEEFPAPVGAYTYDPSTYEPLVINVRHD